MSADRDTPQFPRLQQLLRRFEHVIVVVLIATMAVVVGIAALELVWLVLKDIFSPPVLWLDVNELLDIFSFVLLILIGIELMETVKGYLKDNVIHVEIVLEVALIAIARKVIVLDPEKYGALTLFALAALILALALGFFLERRARRLPRRTGGSR